MGAINFNTNTNLFIKDNSSSNSYNLQKGSIFSGVITSRDSTNVTVQSKGATLTLNSNEVKGNLNDTVNFEVVGRKEQSYVLKQVQATKTFDNTYYSEYSSSLKDEEVLDMLKENNYIKGDSSEREALEQAELEKLALRRLQRAINQGDANLTSSLAKSIQSSGLSSEKVSLTSLNQLVSENLSTTTNIDEGINNTNSQNNIDENLKSLFKSNGFTPSQNEINKSLEFVNNLKDISANVDKVDIKYILQNELDVNMENLSKYRGINTLSQNTDLSSSMENSIINRLESLGLTSSDNNCLNTAKVLVGNNIPLTSENIKSYDFLTNNLQNLSDENLVKIAFLGYKNNLDTRDINIAKASENVDTVLSTENVRDLNALKNTEISDSTFIYLEENSIEFSISNVLNNIKESTNANTQIDLSENALLQKRYYVEASLKLTSESLGLLSKNKIDTFNISLVNLHNELKNIDITLTNTRLLESDIEPTTSNTEALSTSTSFVSDLKIFGTSMYENIAINSSTTTLSIKNLSKNYSNQMDWQLSKNSGEYNFKRVENQIAELLKNLDVGATEDNIQSASILIKNKLDVTKESLLEVSSTVAKLDYLKENLTPQILTNIIKDGENPTTMEFDEIISYINSYKEVYGDTNNEKLLKNLVKMDKDKNISDETLEAVKSVYKALNKVSKYGVASVGELLRGNFDLTLEDLVNSSKTFDKFYSNKTNIDVSLGENLEYTVSTISEDTNILEIINKEVKYNKNALDIHNFMQNANYENLKTYLDENENSLDELLPIITEELKNLNNQNSQSLDDMIQNITGSNPSSEVLSMLLSQKIIPSKKNINTLASLEKDENLLSKSLDSLDLNLGNYLDENIPFDLACGKLLDIAIGEVNKEPDIDNISTEKIDLTLKANDLLNMQKHLSNTKSNYFSIPIELEGSSELTSINVFVNNQEAVLKENVSVHLSLYTNSLKEITANAEINKEDNSFALYISCNENSAKLLQKNETLFLETLNSLGYENVSISYNTDISQYLFKGLKG